jgi:hypothetical protein
VAIGALSQARCELVISALKTRGATETTAVCPFCGVGCGQVVSSRDGAVINIEGAAVTRDQGQVTMRSRDIVLARMVGPSVGWCRLVRSRFYLHRFQRTGEVEHRDQAQARHRHPRA